jgi:hypothetical protein
MTNSTATRIAAPATPAQRAFLSKLIADAAELGVTLHHDLDALSKHSASYAIDGAKLAISEARRQQPVRRPARDTQGPAETVTEGMYLADEVIYKVQRAVHGSGNLYAKRLVVDEYGSARFEYAPGAIRTLTAEHKMTLEQAKAFGALYGSCVVCGATLTNEDSIAAGIGPICAGRF